MTAASATVLELVVFRLRDSASREQFLETAEPVSSWISTQPGFVSRELYHDDGGDRWVDVVRWRSLGEAEAAAELAMTSASCRPMFELIDLETTLMLHGELAAPPVHEASPVAAA